MTHFSYPNILHIPTFSVSEQPSVQGVRKSEGLQYIYSVLQKEF